MKKLILGLLAAILMSAGLVATAGAPAQAECGNPDPAYSACFETATGLTVDPRRDGPRKRVFNASVAAVGTDARPVGSFVFRFKRVNGGASFATRIVPENGRVTLTRKFNRGIWNVRVRFVAKDGSIFQNSRSGNRQFRVRR